MFRTVAIVAGTYGVWVAVNIAIAAFNLGDGGVSAHLSLLFTGAPMSMLTLAMPNATLPAVVVAGILGLLQSSLVAWVAGRPRLNRGARSEAQ